MSVATGSNEYWLLYMSIGNLHNSTHHAHWEGVLIIGFLSIPKGQLWELLPMSCLICFLCSWQGISWKQHFLQVSLSTTPYVPSTHPPPAQECNGQAHLCEMSWWKISEGGFWDWPIHHRLSWAMPACLCCTGLVPKVHGPVILSAFFLLTPSGIGV